jgi:hypothetical protein
MPSPRLCGAVLTAALGALPAFADEKVTPRYLTLPGTDTRLKIYGIAWFNSWYYFDQNLYDGGSLVAGQADALGARSTPDRQFGMTARNSRIGFTTLTPSGRLGDVTTLVEMDFTKEKSGSGGLKLRHAYASFGPWLVGHTWSNWLDTDAGAETVDMSGPVGQACNGASRFTQVRFRQALGRRASLAFSLEQNRLGWGAFPGDVVNPPAGPSLPDSRYPTPTVAWTFTDDWGHLALRAMGQDYGVYTPATAGSPRGRADGWGGGLQVSAAIRLGADKLVGSIYGGRALGEYGVGIQGVRYDPAAGQFLLYRNLGWQAGYTHAWTTRVRSNLVLSGVSFRNDAAVAAATLSNSFNGFVNTFIKLGKAVELGMEYGFEDLRTFGASDVTSPGGGRTDRNRSSKLQVSLTATF